MYQKSGALYQINNNNWRLKMTKKYGDFSLEELREINFVVSCVLQDKKDLRPTAEQHLKNIFKKTFDTLRCKQERQDRLAEDNANIERVDAQTRGKNNV